MMFMCEFDGVDGTFSVPINIDDDGRDRPLRGSFYHRGAWNECSRDWCERADSEIELAASTAAWLARATEATFVSLRPWR